VWLSSGEGGKEKSLILLDGEKTVQDLSSLSVGKQGLLHAVFKKVFPPSTPGGKFERRVRLLFVKGKMKKILVLPPRGKADRRSIRRKEGRSKEIRSRGRGGSPSKEKKKNRRK